MACSGWVISYLVSTAVVYKNIDITFPSVKSCVNIWDNHCYQLHYSRCTHSHFIGMHNSSYCRVSSIPVMPLFHYFTLFHCFLCTKQIWPHSEGRPIYKEGTNELARSSLLQIPSCLIQEIAQWKETHIVWVEHKWLHLQHTGCKCCTAWVSRAVTGQMKKHVLVTSTRYDSHRML